MHIQPVRRGCRIAVCNSYFLGQTHSPRFLVAIVTFTLIAVLAARLGAWCGLLCGGRDYGVRATAFTFVFYLLICGALFANAEFHQQHLAPASLAASFDPWLNAEKSGVLGFAWYFTKESLAFALGGALVFGWAIFMACIIGGLLFNYLVGILDRPGTTGE